MSPRLRIKRINLERKERKKISRKKERLRKLQLDRRDSLDL